MIYCRAHSNPVLSMRSCWCEGKGWIGMLDAGPSISGLLPGQLNQLPNGLFRGSHGNPGPSHSLSPALLSAGIGDPITAPRQLAAGGHLGTQGTSWGPPAGLGGAAEGLRHTGAFSMLRIGRGGLAGKRQDVTQGCGA
eukprot:1153600-Pelagomonas_calceolata.AAC.2